MKIGIVLGGGGAKCIAHLGVLKALEEMNIQPSIISAVSGGALFGSFYAVGISPDKILSTLLEKGVFNYFQPSNNIDGLFTLDVVERIYSEVLPINTFDELQTPMYVVATDIENGVLEEFSSGDLVKPIMGSSAYPAIFEPVVVNGKKMLDGGILNNFPVEPLKDKCDLIIGSSVGRVYKNEHLNTVKKYFIRSMELAINEADKHRYQQCDFLIETPDLNGYGLFELDKAREIFEKGYQAAIERRADIAEQVAIKGQAN